MRPWVSFPARFRALATAAALLAAPVAASPGAAGSYVLEDVAGTGGGIELGADGRYVWWSNVGTINRRSEGRWRRDGDRVALLPDDPGNSSGIAVAPKSEPWGDEAERSYLRYNTEERWAQIVALCPLLRVRAPAYSKRALDSVSDWRAEAKAARRRLAAARTMAVSQMARWSRAREATPEWDTSLRETSIALEAYYVAQSESDDAHDKARLPPPAEALIEFPAKCTLPRMLPAYEPLPPERHPQIGIVIGDPVMASSFVGATVRIHFSDGIELKRESGPGGWVIVPVRPGSSVTAIGVAIEYGLPAEFTVPVALAGAGVVIVDINPEGFALLALEPRQLQLAARGSLQPGDGRPGRYRRVDP